MSHKKTILILCDWFLPGYLAGGPIQSLATLTKQLGNEIEFKIITTDRDFKSDKCYDEIITNTWTNYEGRTVFYISPDNMNSKFILNLIQNTPHDVIYLNSLYSKRFTIDPLKWKRKQKINSKIVLAPRGMLGAGALAIKPLKKKLFLWYAKWVGLFDTIRWHSTSVQETEKILKLIHSEASITEVSNLSNTADSIIGIEKKQELKLCFVSRILGIKNLDFAIDVLKKITNFPVIFDVYGPKEDIEYWRVCENKAKQLPLNVSFHYKGILKPSQIGETLSQYHALLLPTHTENFGHIIVETMVHGRPVIISNNTPWRNLEEEGVGFDISLNNQNEFIDAINKLAIMNQNEYDRMSAQCVKYIHSKLNVEEIKSKYLNMFYNL